MPVVVDRGANVHDAGATVAAIDAATFENLGAPTTHLCELWGCACAIQS
jgi:hypothetical protein